MPREESILKWEDNLTLYELSVRNVMSLNKEAAIQMSLEETPKGKGNRKFKSINIPLNLVDKFMQAIQS